MLPPNAGGGATRLALSLSNAKARELEEAGHREQAETWRRIEAALMQMRGPHVS